MSLTGDLCRRCGSEDQIVDPDTGETICLDCGLVIHRDNLVKRGYIEEDDGVERSVSTSRKMERLMTIDKRIRVDAEDAYVLRVAVKEILRLTQAMHLPDIVEKTAEDLYRRAQKKGLVLRGTIMGFAAASVYAACRMLGLPRTLREVSEESTEDVKDIARMYRIIVVELGISVELDTPLKHLSRIANEVELSHSAEVLASDLLMELMKEGQHIGKSPEGLVASALYIACKELEEPCTQKVLSEASGVSTLTIRKRVKDIKKSVDVDEMVEGV